METVSPSELADILAGMAATSNLTTTTRLKGNEHFIKTQQQQQAHSTHPLGAALPVLIDKGFECQNTTRGNNCIIKQSRNKAATAAATLTSPLGAAAAAAAAVPWNAQSGGELSDTAAAQGQDTSGLQHILLCCHAIATRDIPAPCSALLSCTAGCCSVGSRCSPEHAPDGRRQGFKWVRYTAGCCSAGLASGSQAQEQEDRFVGTQLQACVGGSGAGASCWCWLLPGGRLTRSASAESPPSKAKVGKQKGKDASPSSTKPASSKHEANGSGWAELQTKLFNCFAPVCSKTIQHQANPALQSQLQTNWFKWKYQRQAYTEEEAKERQAIMTC
eukprot:1143430-Pelagomonas_calceolata.AAC.1